MERVLIEKQDRASVSGNSTYILLEKEWKEMLERSNINGKSVLADGVSIKLRIGYNKRGQLYGEFWFVDANAKPSEAGAQNERV